METENGREFVHICVLHYRPTAREEVSQDVKDARVKYFNSAVQPLRQGVVSKEYLEAHPNSSTTKGFTPEQIKKADYVWKGEPGWDTRKQSK